MIAYYAILRHCDSEELIKLIYWLFLQRNGRTSETVKIKIQTASSWRRIKIREDEFGRFESGQFAATLEDLCSHHRADQGVQGIMLLLLVLLLFYCYC